MRNRIVDLIEAAAVKDGRSVFLTGDLGYSVIERIRDTLGERFINAGVAEANMATMAAALAMNGLRAYIYSITPFATFRCFEQIRNDMCYQGGDVRIIGVGAGFSYGSLGPSHHALEDATILASIPGMQVLCPCGRPELDALFELYESVREPIYFRIGRERGVDLAPPAALSLAQPAWIAREGKDLTALCSGAVIEMALKAADKLAENGISMQVISVPLMHPFPVEAVARLWGGGPLITVVEAYPDNPLETGAMRMVLTKGGGCGVETVNVAQKFPKLVGSHDTLRSAAGLSTQAIEAAARKLLAAR